MCVCIKQIDSTTPLNSLCFLLYKYVNNWWMVSYIQLLLYSERINYNSFLLLLFLFRSNLLLPFALISFRSGSLAQYFFIISPLYELNTLHTCYIILLVCLCVFLSLRIIWCKQWSYRTYILHTLHTFSVIIYFFSPSYVQNAVVILAMVSFSF